MDRLALELVSVLSHSSSLQQQQPEEESKAFRAVQPTDAPQVDQQRVPSPASTLEVSPMASCRPNKQQLSLRDRLRSHDKALSPHCSEIRVIWPLVKDRKGEHDVMGATMSVDESDPSFQKRGIWL